MLLFIVFMIQRSELLHADHVDRLDVVLPGGDLVEDIVSEHLVVLDHAAHLQLLHSIGNVQNLWLLVPDQSLDFQSQDFLDEALEVETRLVHLHVEHQDRFRNRLGLGGLWLGLLLRLGLFNRSGIIIAKEINIVFVLCGCGLGSSGCVLSSPSLYKCG